MEKKTKVLIGIFGTLTVVGLSLWGLNILRKRKIAAQLAGEKVVPTKTPVKSTGGTSAPKTPTKASGVYTKYDNVKVYGYNSYAGTILYSNVNTAFKKDYFLGAFKKKIGMYYITEKGFSIPEYDAYVIA